MIRAVIWDIGEVLISYKYRYPCLRLARHSLKNPEEIQRIVFGDKVTGWGPGILSYHFDLNEWNTARFISELRKKLGISSPPLGPSAKDIAAMFDNCCGMDREIRRLLWFLSEADKCGRVFTQGILSNINELQFNFVLRTFPTLRLKNPEPEDAVNHPPGVMDFQTTSFQRKMVKPQRGIYASAFAEAWPAHYRDTKHELKLQECLFLDDRMENVVGAKAAGLNADLVEVYGPKVEACGPKTIFDIFERWNLPLPPDDYVPKPDREYNAFLFSERSTR